ncbi:uncharacterized protein LOC111412541 [Olea europaea var. sylvestris]|uniref:uncharacterized protein LOC111412541 n=1 Tax=Olea europaea var. sylvestris TaxID=158386 RepID=UPI000C1D8413|nr:uncharacterized protein LOC111412541 [Olea europaea var. sylvestris]
MGFERLQGIRVSVAQLSRYAPHLVDTEVKKIRRFENGLRPEIGMIIMESLGKRKWSDQNKNRHNWQNKRPSTEVRIGGTSGSITPCPKCNKLHRGECLLGKNMCFCCGKLGHIALNCTEPPRKKDDDQDKNKKAKARVFALNQHKAEQDPNVIAGILLLSDVPAYILFDSGATNSFISASFVTRSNFACVKTNYELEVNIPSGRTLCTNWMTKAMKLEIDGKIILVDLYLLEMKDFDVILGMDWFGLNHAAFDITRKKYCFTDRERKNFFSLEQSLSLCLVLYQLFKRKRC